MACPICGCPDVRWVRVSTVAQQFGCSEKKVRRMIKKGELEGVQFGREWRVDHRSLDRLVAGEAVEADEAHAEAAQ